MDLSKMELMSTELLQSINEKVGDILKRRLDNDIRIGRIAWFKSSRTNEKVYIRITRVNAKTVSGVIVDSVTHMDLSQYRGQWMRVSPGLLNVVPKEKPAAAPSAAPYKPTSVSTSVW